MFRAGDHIEILESSIKSGAGPRRGSAGFFSEVIASFSVSQNSKRFAVVVSNVSFYRFGFEQRLRNEKKTVGLAFPLGPIEGDVASAFKSVRQLVVMEKYAELRNKHSIDSIGRKIDWAFATPAKTNFRSFMDSDQKIVSAWVDSVINERLNNMLVEGTVLTERMYTNAFLNNNEQLLSEIRKAAQSKSLRIKIVREAFDAGSEQVETLLTALRMLVVSYETNKLVAKMEAESELANVFGGFNRDQVGSAFALVATHLFSDVKYRAVLRAVADRVPSKIITPFVKDVEVLRSSVLGLS